MYFRALWVLLPVEVPPSLLSILRSFPRSRF